jgi:hypothetical protein
MRKPLPFHTPFPALTSPDCLGFTAAHCTTLFSHPQKKGTMMIEVNYISLPQGSVIVAHHTEDINNSINVL